MTAFKSQFCLPLLEVSVITSVTCSPLSSSYESHELGVYLRTCETLLMQFATIVFSFS